MASTSVNNSGYFGEVEIGEKALKNSIRILSFDENRAVMNRFMNISNLPKSLIAPNGWGYPYIPIPQLREGYGRIRLAPKGVSRSFLGHPIYWIDPKLTAFRVGETLQEWSIRMFYLIDGFGYWTEKVEFVDFLEVNGFSFTDAQIKTYHLIADDNSETDNYTLLNESMLETSLERVEENYNNALIKCFEIQKREAEFLKRVQIKEYKFGLKAIGQKRLRDWTLNYNDPGSVWDKVFEKNLSEVAEEYNRRALENDPKISDLLAKARKSFDNLQEVLIKFHHASSIMELPVIASVEGNPGGVELIARMATSMRDANSADNIRLSVLGEIDEKIQKTLVGSNKGSGRFDYVINLMRREYAKAWNRLRRAIINFEHLKTGDPIFTSKAELEGYLQRESVSLNTLDMNISEDDGRFQGGGVEEDDIFSIDLEDNDDMMNPFK